MTGIRELPRDARLWVIRWTAIIIGAATLASIAISEIIMLVISRGMNAEGFFVSIAMPVLLGTPMLVYMLVRQQQLKLANAKLAELAATDWLTGCLNRRGFTQDVSAHLHNGGHGVLLVIDVDHFKAVNDRFGHDHGDDVLVGIASAVRPHLRPADRLGRLGGEEFSVFLADADQLTAQLIAERIRHAVEQLEFAPGGTPHGISVSIGGAASGDAGSFAALFRRADQCLYDAKRDGRNCLRFAPALGQPAVAAA
jgi:diguanylate cyclase (GGDEF)-like protein